VNDEIERMWKWSWHIVRYYPGFCLKGLRKTTKKSFFVLGRSRVQISAGDRIL
jgi:hypothetical protein